MWVVGLVGCVLLCALPGAVRCSQGALLSTTWQLLQLYSAATADPISTTLWALVLSALGGELVATWHGNLQVQVHPQATAMLKATNACNTETYTQRQP